MMQDNAFNIVVLLSGNGSNLQAILDYIVQEHLPCQIKTVISNQKEAYGLERARQAGIQTFLVEHIRYQDRMMFEKNLIEKIDLVTPKLVVLAGFMRRLTTFFVQHYKGRLINIHPSLLPKFSGLQTHERALEAKETMHGATVHFVTEKVDKGPVILQGTVPVLSDDTPTTLEQRVHQIEHQIYPLAIRWFVEKRIYLHNNRVYVDGKPLPRAILFEAMHQSD